MITFLKKKNSEGSFASGNSTTLLYLTFIFARVLLVALCSYGFLSNTSKLKDFIFQ